jgi:hypothetical protein
MQFIRYNLSLRHPCSEIIGGKQIRESIYDSDVATLTCVLANAGVRDSGG